MAGRFSVDAVFRAVDRMTGPVRRMQRGVGRFSKSAEMSLRRVDRVAGRVSRTLRRGLTRGLTVATGAMAATVVATNSMAASADELGKTTRDMEFPIEQFQEYRFAAQQAGIDNGTFSKSLEAMNRRLGQAQEGTGTMFTRLKDLSPQLLENMLQAENNAEALAAYREGLRGVDDPARRAAISAAVFSNSGQDMQRMAQMTDAELKKLMATQRENGNVTREQSKQAELYNDTMSELQGAIQGLTRDVLLPLLPVLTDVMQETRGWINENKELIATGLHDFVRDVADNLDTIIASAKAFAATLGTWFAFHGALKVAIALMTAFNAVMAMNPIVLIVIAIAAVVAGIVLLGMWLGKLGDWMGMIRTAGEWAMNVIRGGIEIVMAAVGLLIRAWGAWASFWDDLWTGATVTVQNIAAIVATVWDGVIQTMQDAWGGFAGFWDGLWGGLVSVVETAMSLIQPIIDAAMAGIDTVMSGIASVRRVFGFGDDDDEEQTTRQRARGGMVSPAERTSREISESRSEDTSTVTIRDETGRAEQEPRQRVRGVTLARSGA